MKSTKEQVAIRTEMADIIRQAIEEKYGPVKTWVEAESIGPFGGVSAQVFGAVEHEGRVVPFAVNVYSDARIQEKVECRLDQEAQDNAIRGRLGW